MQASIILPGRDMPTHFTYYNRERARELSETPNDGHLYSVLEFLIDQEVLKREVREAEERFHLSRYWKVVAKTYH